MRGQTAAERQLTACRPRSAVPISRQTLAQVRALSTSAFTLNFQLSTVDCRPDRRSAAVWPLTCPYPLNPGSACLQMRTPQLPASPFLPPLGTPPAVPSSTHGTKVILVFPRKSLINTLNFTHSRSTVSSHISLQNSHRACRPRVAFPGFSCTTVSATPFFFAGPLDRISSVRRRSL